MFHPLVTTSIELAKCGLDDRNDGNFPYRSPRFYHLASTLLSTEHKTFTLNRNHKGYKNENAVAIAFNGGLVSWCAAYLAIKDGFDVKLVYAYHPSEYSRANHYAGIDFALWVYEQGTKITFSHEPIDIHMRGEFAGKNLILASVCSIYAKRIWIPVTTDQITKDCSSTFFRESSQLFSEFYGQPYWVQSTTSHLTSSLLVKEYLSKGGTLDALSKSVSCDFLEKGKHCGVCYHCFRRYRIFQDHDFAFDFATHPKDGVNYIRYFAGDRV